MKFGPLHAEADVIGGRVVVTWAVELDAAAGERLADVPDVEIRRKHHDFVFPTVTDGEPDPALVWSTAAGAGDGAGDLVTDTFDVAAAHLPPRVAATVHTVTGSQNGGAPVGEVLRWTETVERDENGRAVRLEYRVVDLGGTPHGLPAGRTCYYERRALAPLPGDDVPPRPSRAVATPTARHGTGVWMYDSLPGVLTRHDTQVGPPPPPGAIPEATGGKGQLRRFVDLFGCAADHLRSRAEGLATLRDVETTDARVLPRLAQWVGWDLAVDRAIPEQRHEVRHAANLYRITGTLPGCKLWVRRLTGWDPAIKEFWPNVMFTNDLGNPDDPRDRGSRTVDTADTALIAGLGGPDDGGDYTYDTAPGGRYALNKVGVFVTPDPADDARSMRAKRARLLDNQRLFMPFSVQTVLIVDGEDERSDETIAVPVTTTDDSEG